MTIVVSIHDVAPATWSSSRRLLDEVEARGLVSSLLVVPGPWRGGQLRDATRFAAWLTDAAGRGHEPVLHGWTHTRVADVRQTTPLWRRTAAHAMTRGCAEFVGLDHASAAVRLRAGRAELARCDLDVVGFTPPGWWASPPTDRALAALGFSYTTRRPVVVDLVTGRHLSVPAVCQRPNSPLTTTAARWVLRRIERAVRCHEDLRVALHADDVLDRRIAGITTRVLDLCASTGRCTTYKELVGSRRPDEMTRDAA